MATAHKSSYWTNIADMMSGLMMIFLFISVSYMASIQKKATSYFDLQKNLYQDLSREFQDDLSKWQARIDPKTAAIRFAEPDILFLPGSSELRPKFKDVLDNFFPRYLAIIARHEYKASVEEIRIEGHTSTDWLSQTGTDAAYFNNMRLSQDRTRSVLEYAMAKTAVDERVWLRGHLTANGLSFSKPIVRDDGAEDKDGSRRVEFRVRMKAEERMQNIAEGK